MNSGQSTQQQLTPISIDLDADAGTVQLSQANAQTLNTEINWFVQVLTLRMDLYFKLNTDKQDINELPVPDLQQDTSDYASVVKQYQFGFDERLVLILALIPHIKPQVLDSLFIRNQNFDRGYTEFGGKQGQHHGGFLPSCETAVFILAGDDLAKRFSIISLFEHQHSFTKASILQFDRQAQSEPFFSSGLSISSEFLNRCTTGITEKLDYSISFPAKLITTALKWQDLVLAPDVMDEVSKMNTWIAHSDVIMKQWGMGKTLKPGYRSLFYGPPGTGKTLTATLIGAQLGFDVYRIDLSSMVSKYIGETEKNLANLFDQAQNKNWILFFDEADALFGTRTGGSSANDRHSNQEIAYLLQRVEDFPGLVILATNLRANIDEAFSRRFQSLIYFPMPDAEQRLQLWQKTLNGKLEQKGSSELAAVAEKHELSGGAITNVVRYGAISAIEKGKETIAIKDLKKGIAKELRKEGRTI
jgi:hypothetical protein